MTGIPPWMHAVVARIDRFTDATGWLLSLSMLFLLFSISYECFMRYALNSPTIWAWDMGYMVNGSAFMLGCGYALLKGAHVRTDIFWERYTPRTKGVVDLVSYLLLFFPAMIALLWVGGEATLDSLRLSERSEQSAWRVILWPFRAAMPLGVLLLMLQGVSETMKSWYAVKTGAEYQARAKVEV